MEEQDRIGLELPTSEQLEAELLRLREEGLGEAGEAEDGKPVKRMSYGQAVLVEFGLLLLKIAAIAALAVLAFTFLFAGTRCQDKDMLPAVQDGDLVIAYRLDKKYVSDDLCVLVFDGAKEVRRVMATAGDIVDINEDGFYINGGRQIEPVQGVTTERYDTGVEFPLRVGEGQVFVLGDARANATDSRVYGLVEVEDTLGKVMLVLRRRQF